MQLVSHKIKVGTNTISYWDSGNVLANNVVILLAPGAYTGDVFSDSINNIQSDDIRFIAPNYPGRGESHYICPGLSALDNCASEVITLLDILNIGGYSIMAVSFGTMVADSMLNMDAGKCKDCILIAAGEYFNSKQRAIFKLWRNDFRNKLEISEEMLDFVRFLKSKCIKVAVLSNNISPYVEVIKERDGYKDFDIVLNSCEVGCSKPDDNIYLLALNKLGIKANEILFVDDRQENLDTAKRLGMKVELVTDIGKLKQDIRNALSESIK